MLLNNVISDWQQQTIDEDWQPSRISHSLKPNRYMIDLRSPENILETSETKQETLFLAYYMLLTPPPQTTYHRAASIMGPHDVLSKTLPGGVDADHFTQQHFEARKP